MTRIVVICPGRGSYSRTELGSLTDSKRPDPRGVRADLVARADRHRDAVRRERVSDLDRRPRLGAEHLAGENAAALIYTASMADATLLADGFEVVAVLGNSMGWYTALHVAGALGFEDGLRLADAMGSFQKDGVIGGQVIVPVVDADWGRVPSLDAAVAHALDAVHEAGHVAWTSIRLGGYDVLAGDAEAIRLLLQLLPKSRVGEKDYPFQLLGHSAFHTPLMGGTSAKARAQLADLGWQAPHTTLIDGRGHQFRPRTARPGDLRDYTLMTQVVDTYDFTTSVRVALREFAPDALVLLGPGDALGGALGQILVQEGWHTLHSKSDFIARQAGTDAIVLALAREAQALALENRRSGSLTAKPSSA